MSRPLATPRWILAIVLWISFFLRGPDALKPFGPRLPEFAFWYSTTKATMVAFLMTFFENFKIPNHRAFEAAYWIFLSGLVAFTIRRSCYYMSFKTIPPKSD
ncbi:hypothetical protein AALP_AA7G246000 [Arabis alpina]|uniref:Uncharacterized protein n=1 Tax=Arabis alpina TaxID=50452 RepID=A0A087GKB4_ARAAL|nr:hypothetical protein AALP_AA7G246000 [Arabis alpina]